MNLESIATSDKYKILKLGLKYMGKIEITVSGTSMFPFLFQGDKISVVSSTEYKNGDVLVFCMKKTK